MRDVSHTPVWLMRQAGRYMQFYRDIRSKIGFLDLCYNSDLVCEVTVKAQEMLNVDAAIIFSDILLILSPMGLHLEYSNKGPCIDNLSSPEAVLQLQDEFDFSSKFRFISESITKTRASLHSDIPLIGFSGSPFTLAYYIIEHHKSNNADGACTKKFMYQYPLLWDHLMKKLTKVLQEYVNCQIQHGVQSIQIFDTWAGTLSTSDYHDFVLPYIKNLFDGINGDVPIIYFSRNTSHILKNIYQNGCDVVSVDWTVDLEEILSSSSLPIQGNLDPSILLCDKEVIRNKVHSLLRTTQNRTGYIFNLGHGVLPQTPFDNVKYAVDLVREFNEKY